MFSAGVQYYLICFRVGIVASGLAWWPPRVTYKISFPSKVNTFAELEKNLPQNVGSLKSRYFKTDQKPHLSQLNDS